jgi:hypothetical protein
VTTNGSPTWACSRLADASALTARMPFWPHAAACRTVRLATRSRRAFPPPDDRPRRPLSIKLPYILISYSVKSTSFKTYSVYGMGLLLGVPQNPPILFCLG